MSDPVNELWSMPCIDCGAGRHNDCQGICGCIADHDDDQNIIRGFKRLKRMMHPEREAWTKGGWSGG